MKTFASLAKDMAKDSPYLWHKKTKGERQCSRCGCKGVRAGTKHRMILEEHVIRYEKLIKVSFGQDTSIEPII